MKIKLSKLEKELYPINKKPSLSIYLFNEEPVALIVKENKQKIILLEDLVDTIASIKTKSKTVEFLEEGTRVNGKTIKIVELPEEKKKIRYLKENKIKEKEFFVPKRIWIVNKEDPSKSKMFLIKEWKEEKTEIYINPFPNVYENNTICWGNERTKKPSAKEIDTIFFESTFTADLSKKIVYKDLNSMNFIEECNKIEDFNNLKKIGTIKKYLEEQNDF